MKKAFFMCLVGFFSLSARAELVTTMDMTCIATSIKAPEASSFGLDKMQSFRFLISPFVTYDDPTNQGGFTKAEINKLSVSNNERGTLTTAGVTAPDSSTYEFWVHLPQDTGRNSMLQIRFNAIHNMAQAYYLSSDAGIPSLIADLKCDVTHVKY